MPYSWLHIVDTVFFNYLFVAYCHEIHSLIAAILFFIFLKHLFSACYYKIQPLIAANIILIILSYTVAIAGIANLQPSLQVTQLVHWVGHKLGPQFSLELPATRGVCII